MKIAWVDSGLGIVPFLKEILRQKKFHTYFFYSDEAFFPYGEKSESEIASRLPSIEKALEPYQLDRIFIACNTLSTFAMERKDTILATNLAHLQSNNRLLVTSLCQKRLEKYAYPADAAFSLAKAIETKQISQCLKEIKAMKKQQSYILSCTHFPLVRFLFDRYYLGEVSSYEKEVVAALPEGQELIVYSNIKDLSRLQEFFPRISIKPFPDAYSLNRRGHYEIF